MKQLLPTSPDPPSSGCGPGVLSRLDSVAFLGRGRVRLTLNPKLP